ncbi:hypothetical protein V8E55_003157 [Tylopilus felleus]
MFIRPYTALLSVLALAGIASAVPSRKVRDGSSSECDTGSVQCCNSVQSVRPSLIDVGDLENTDMAFFIGFTCSLITLGSISVGSSCTSQPVCCNDDTFNGISTGCSPITINL